MLFGNNTINEKCRFNVDFVYAHGKLEEHLHHDLLCAEQDTRFEPGVWPAQVTDNEGKVLQCVVFAWGTNIRRHGLCVFCDDREALVYAAQCFVEEPRHI